MISFAVFMVLFILDQKKIIRNKNTQIKILDEECKQEIEKLKQELADIKKNSRKNWDCTTDFSIEAALF